MHTHQVGGGHLIVEIFLRGARRAQQIVLLERGEIEEQYDHAVIAHDGLDFLRRSDRAERHRDGVSSPFPAVSTCSISLYSNVEIFCALPSSVTLNCDCFKPL